MRTAAPSSRPRSAGALPSPDGLVVLVEEPLNAESPREALASAVTPTDRFFVRTHFPIPRIAPSAWRLVIGGAVGRPRRWSLEELRSLPQRELAATLECAGNGRRRYARPAPGELRWGDHAVGSAVWRGVPLATLLEESGLSDEARHLVFTGADLDAASEEPRRFVRGLTADLEEHRDVLVALEMNGRPLSPEHGAPARLVVPGWYGMAWVKWLEGVTAGPTAHRGHFQTSRYVYRYRRAGRSVTEPVRRLRVKSLIVTPAPGADLARGTPVRLRGKAWSGTDPVVRVEVDVGDGWQAARLLPGHGPYDWSSWELEWSPRRRGRTVLRARATDAGGETQPAEPFANEFQYGCNAIQQVPVEVA